MTLNTIYMLMTHLFIFLALTSPWICSNMSNCLLDICTLMSNGITHYICNWALEVLPQLQTKSYFSLRQHQVKTLWLSWCFLIFHTSHLIHEQILKPLPSKYIQNTVIFLHRDCFTLAQVTCMMPVIFELAPFGPHLSFTQKDLLEPHVRVCHSSLKNLWIVSHLTLKNSPNQTSQARHRARQHSGIQPPGP